MLATLRLSRPSTYAEYLATEQHSECRHELIAVHRRDQAGLWKAVAEVYGTGEVVTVGVLNDAIAVDDVYQNILDTEGRSLLR